MMESNMTVQEIVNLISFGTKWQLIGTETLKVLCTSNSMKKIREKYMNKRVRTEPLRADFYVSKQSPTVESIKPMISIWVSGE